MITGAGGTRPTLFTRVNHQTAGAPHRGDIEMAEQTPIEVEALPDVPSHTDHAIRVGDGMVHSAALRYNVMRRPSLMDRHAIVTVIHDVNNYKVVPVHDSVCVLTPCNIQTQEISGRA